MSGKKEPKQSFATQHSTLRAVWCQNHMDFGLAHLAAETLFQAVQVPTQYPRKRPVVPFSSFLLLIALAQPGIGHEARQMADCCHELGALATGWRWL